MIWLRRLGFASLFTLGALYMMALAYLYVFQRLFLYAPSPVEISPAEVKLPQAQVVRLKTMDGETIVAWWIPPQGDKPVTLFLHGNGDRLDKRAKRFEMMIEKGEGLLAVSYRGYGGSTGSPSEEGLHADAVAAYTWLVERMPPERIVVHGYSLGTAVAVKLASEHPIKALALESPFLSALAMAKLRYGMFPVALLMKDPFRSDEYITRIKAPVIILHGTADPTVPFAQGRALYEKALNPKQFVAYEGANHTNLGEFGALNAIRDFVAAQSVKTATSPVPSLSGQ
jgi:uncharacterized protein